MSDHATRSHAVQAERRRTRRFPVEIPVALRTINGTRQCRLGNVSDAGANLELENPPAVGVCGWLVMSDEEVYCRVVWSNEASCGIAFERALPIATLEGIVGAKLPAHGPLINHGNIPMGRKRAGLVPRGE
jgi:hypothetical protein